LDKNNHTLSLSSKSFALIKWSLVVFALAFLTHQLFFKYNVFDWYEKGQRYFNEHAFNILWVLLIMPINWFLESFKWYLLMKPYGPISLAASVRGTLMGVAIGLFTPNGVGEFAGRMLAVPDSIKEEAVGTGIVSSMAQLAVTLTIGASCLIAYFLPNTAWNVFWITCTLSFGVFAYFWLPNLVAKLFMHVPFLKRYDHFISALATTPKSALAICYFITFLRYLTFFTALFILLKPIAETNITLSTLALVIPIYFYVKTLIPTIALSEIGIRGAIIIYLIPLSVYGQELIFATTYLWLANVILPALLGLVFLTSSKLSFKRKQRR
jgi:hypothetical protein